MSARDWSDRVSWPRTFIGRTAVSLVGTEAQGSGGRAVGSRSRPLPISLSQKHLCPAPPSAGPAVLCLQRQSPAGPRPPCHGLVPLGPEPRSPVAT